MSSRVSAALLVVAGLVLLGVVAVVLLRADDSGYDDAGVAEGSLSVPDALMRAPQQEVAISGFAFDDPSWEEPRLCTRREDGDPPACIGPYIRLSGLALDRIPWEREDGSAHSPEAVTLVGVLTADELAVNDVVSR